MARPQIDCPKTQPRQLVRRLVTGRQKDHGNIRSCADLLHQGKAVAVREHHIQNRQIRLFRLGGGKTLFPIGGGHKARKALVR